MIDVSPLQHHAPCRSSLAQCTKLPQRRTLIMIVSLCTERDAQARLNLHTTERPYYASRGDATRGEESDSDTGHQKQTLKYMYRGRGTTRPEQLQVFTVAESGQIRRSMDSRALIAPCKSVLPCAECYIRPDH
ncbi:hypothetical protein BDV98DRAFT_310003 [Pterulicium gracile]|uniref:Uncharacterized protein n=1 Tax=Pterulicium gracile TaxID=1884261 RepID=A0A5C3Q854_9AGAR|nr:hypothetical protein BDV98DRAFT_310003 [Pterula gracilis]